MRPTRPMLLGLSLALSACPATTPDDVPPAGDDDDAVACADNLCILSGTLTDDLVLTADTDWLLRGGVFVGDDVNPTTLTIEPGTTIYGESSTDGMLVVRRNARLVADGTADAPIVFTSSKEDGSRARGDWGGLILNGNAPINSCGDGEGACEAFGEGGTGWYGGDDADDDSGVLRYVRVEFAGTLISPDNELNGIAFQGVGRGTTVDYVQVHMNADDGVEFFGGTVEAKHLLLTGIGDDNIDWTDGWQGKIQFAVAQQYEDNGDNGIEADNNGDDNSASPRSMPTLSNITLIGVPGGASSDLGLLLREGTAGALSNLVVTGFADACLDVDHAETFAQVDSGDLTISHSILDCATPFGEDATDPTTVAAFFDAGDGNELGDPGLVDPLTAVSPGFAPAPTSLAATGGSAPADAFFDAVTFRGGVGPDDDWTAGWTTSAAH
jgi:hypothetical protein